ncbi:MAG: hypothetical protein U1E87_03480 [Alphaproteobacteria bacterium]
MGFSCRVFRRRVGASGEAVLSGHGEPGSRVSAILSGEALGASIVSDRGEWSIVIDRPLNTGPLEITLKADREAGAVRSEDAIVLDFAGPGITPIALNMRFGQPSRFLQRPDDLPAAALSVDSADYDTAGGFSISGHAAPGSAVRIYLDNQPVGDAAVDAGGGWVFRPKAITPGAYTMRVDQLGLKALVVQRLEVPFERLDAAAVTQTMLGDDDTLAVQPGENLWRIACASPGLGFQYAVLYRSREEQARDPNLVYPGQVFEVAISQ